jgi:hypothetical protein
MPLSIDFMPDWIEDYDAEHASVDLGIEVSGEGWYLVGKDTMLVVLTGDGPRPFRIHGWDGRNPADAFNRVAHAATRLDARDPSNVWPPGAGVRIAKSPRQ